MAEAGVAASDIPTIITAATSGSKDALAAIPGMTPALIQLTNNKVADAYGKAFAYVYYTALALGAICILASVSLRDFDHYLTDHVSRQVYRKEETNVDPLAQQNAKLESPGEKASDPADTRVEDV